MTQNGARSLGAVAVAREIGISLRQLYYWIDVLKAVTPTVHRHGSRQFRHFNDHDIVILRGAKQLTEQGYTLRAAVAMAQRRSNHSA